MHFLSRLPFFLAQVDQTPDLPPYQPAVQLSPVALVFMAIVVVAIIVLMAASMWKVFTKAGRPDWAAIIPIYSIVVLWQITGKPGWVLALTLFPCTFIIGIIVLSIALAESFGKTAGFGIGLALLSFIFYPILAFGDAQYRGPAPATL